MMGTAQAEPDYAYAATGFVGGGGSWLSRDGDDDDDDDDIAHIVAGGDIVLPLHGYWNVQLGGAFHTDHQHFFRGRSDSTIQFQGGVIGFWRDPAMGVFGIEAGFYAGGHVTYYASDNLAFAGFRMVLSRMVCSAHACPNAKLLENDVRSAGVTDC